MGTTWEAPEDGAWGNAGTCQTHFPQGTNHQLSSMGRGRQEAICPVGILQLEQNLNSLAGKPTAPFLRIASKNA